MDDALAILENAYVWRQELRKREGLQLIGRLRRVFTTASIGLSGASPWSISSIYSNYVPSITPEATAEIEPGSVIITIAAGPDIVFTDQGNGLLTSTTPGNSGYINYLTGDIVLVHTAGAGVAATATFSYFPTLPVMGIKIRELSGINDEQTMWFDTKYCYVHDGADFSEYLSTASVTWDSSDSDFFSTTNYRGSIASERLFFETNFVSNASNPMRYTDGVTWETFKPIIGGEQQTQVMTTALAAGSLTYGPDFISPLPILEGTVVITVTANDGQSSDIIYTDVLKDGTLTGTDLNTGTIIYATGEINLNFNPALPGSSDWTVTVVYDQEGTYLLTCQILVPYYGRLVALNTYEGTDYGTGVNIFNRARFSQIGNPVQADAWRSDVFGKGGFVDAPTNERIIGAEFYKNTLIVSFERSTWRLQYLGEYGIPFIWERISSDFGSESTFSTVLFDDGVLYVGDKAIVASSGTDVKRIDVIIPDTVYSFKNADEGPQRVCGIRDFKKELVYWAYPDFTKLLTNQIYPNWSLVYNYRNNTFAFFRNSVTALGNFAYPADITWDRLDVFWDDDPEISWDTTSQKKLPLIASGNQQGFCHFYGYDDVETTADSQIAAGDQESLTVTNVTVTASVDVVLEIKNHNLQNDEFIYLTGLNYVDTTPPFAAGSTTLNDQIYIAQYVDKDNIRLFIWDTVSQLPIQNFQVTNVGTYVGGGVVALFPRLLVRTKDFNPLKTNTPMNIKTSYIDFLFDASVPSPLSVEMRMNTTNNAIGNILVGNQQIEMSNSMTGFIQNISLTNPCVIQSNNHGLLTGTEIGFSEISGTTELNGNQYTVTFISVNSFSVNVDATGFTPYVSGGYWTQTAQQYFTLSAQYSWHRFFSNCIGQFLSLNLTYNNDQMSQISTHRQNLVLNAIKIFYLPGGRNIFGK